MPARLLVVALALSVGGCSPAAQWSGTLEERDGVVYAANPAAGLWQGREPPPLRFELEEVFGAEADPEEAIIGSIRGAACDDDGNLYVLDGQIHRLVAFTPDGSVRWVAGREGEGPGELGATRGLAVHAGTLYVLNRGGTFIDIWDTSGKYHDSHALLDLDLGFTGFVSLTGLLAPDTLVFETVAGGQTGISVRVVRMGEPWQLSGQFDFNALPEQPIDEHYAVSVDAAVRGDHILVGGNTHYGFRVYDRTGRLLRVVSREVDYLRPAGVHSTGSGSMIAGFGGVDAPIELASGHWLTGVRWPTNADDPDVAVAKMMSGEFETEWDSSLDLFDPDGRFLYSLVSPGAPAPEIGTLLFVGPSGRLYTSLEDPFPQVRRYRVVIDD